MEGVAAFGEQPEVVFGLELTETHSAVERVLDSDDGFVIEHGERVDEGLIDAGVVQVEELLQLALKGSYVIFVHLVGASSSSVWGPEQESDEEVEQAGDEENDCEDDDD